MRKKTTKYFKSIMALIGCVLMVIPSISVPVVADDKEEFLKNVEDAGYKDGVDGYITKIDKEYTDSAKNGTVQWYMQYLLSPGPYINDISYYVKADSNSDDSMVRSENGHKYICGWNNEPQNLLNHNCDIPAFGTEMAQNITQPFSDYGIQGEGTTSSYIGKLGFGLPIGLSLSEDDKKVPVNPKERTRAYSALELYGYDLPIVNYLGEYDHIVVSTPARLMSNVGFWGKAKVAGYSAFQGFKNILSPFVDGWIFNPQKWAEPHAGFVGGVVSTVVDSSDYNVAATHAWKRPYFSSTLYNVYYMTDKEITEKGQADFLKYIIGNLYNELAKDPETQEVLYLMPGSETFPVFTFNDKKYTEKSKNKLEKWEKCTKNKKGKALKQCGTKPELVVVPEEDQFAEWKKENDGFNQKALKHGIDCFGPSKTYKELTTCWTEPYTEYAKKTLHHNNKVFQTALENLKKKFFEERPHLDPNRGISHYVIADENGIPKGNLITDWQYIYEKDNSRIAEFKTKNAPEVRPSIKGGKYGTGDNIYNDTRNIQYRNSGGKASVNIFGKLGRGIAKFSAKLTNTLLSLSYSNILDKLGLVKMVEDLTIAFRDSLFFPLSLVAVMVSAIYLMFQFLRMGVGVLKQILILILTYVLAAVMLFNIGPLLKLSDELPHMIDEAIGELILTDNPASSYCYSEGKDGALRQAQCNVWNIAVFQPWLASQWGTKYHNLDNTNMKNKNSGLVGEGAVDMGNGHLVKNWALYQLSQSKSGTITTNDTKSTTGEVKKSMYKLVDLQAGPNNGKLSDSRYFDHWAGNTGGRSLPLFLSGIVGIMLLITIGTLALVKIAISLELAFKVFGLPFIFLLGLFPRGEGKLKQYLIECVGYLLQRIVLVALLSVTLNLLSVISSSDGDYTLVAIVSLAVLVGIKMYWTEFVNGLSEGVSPIEAITQKFNPINVMPPSLKFAVLSRAEAIKQGFGGTVGGFLAGTKVAHEIRKNNARKKDGSGADISYSNVIKSGISEGYTKGSNRATSMAYNRQRRNGFGIMSKFGQAYSAGANVGISQLMNKPTDKLKDNIETTFNILNGKSELLANEINATKENIKKNIDTTKNTEHLEKLLEKQHDVNDAISVIKTATSDTKATEIKHLATSGSSNVDKAVTDLVNERVVVRNDDKDKLFNRTQKAKISTETPAEMAERFVNQVKNAREQDIKEAAKNTSKVSYDVNGNMNPPLSKYTYTAKKKITKGKNIIKKEAVESMPKLVKDKINYDKAINDAIDKIPDSNPEKASIKSREAHNKNKDKLYKFNKNDIKKDKENLVHKIDPEFKKNNPKPKTFKDTIKSKKKNKH